MIYLLQAPSSMLFKKGGTWSTMLKACDQRDAPPCNVEGYTVW